MFKTPLMQAPALETLSLFDVNEVELGWRRGTQTDNYRAVSPKQFRGIVRVSKNEFNAPIPRLLNIVSPTYKLIDNEELYTYIEEQIIDVIGRDAVSNVKIKDDASHFGRITWREYIFPQLSSNVPLVHAKGEHKDSKVAFRLIIKNSYGGSALQMLYGAIDFFCTNGMIRGKFDNEYHRHSSGLRVEKVGYGLLNALTVYNNSMDEFNKWQDTPIQHEEAMRFFKSICASPRQMDSFIDAFEGEIYFRGVNKWALYSTLTGYASHNTGPFKVKENDNDSTAYTMHRREIEVMKWTQTTEFARLGVV